MSSSSSTDMVCIAPDPVYLELENRVYGYSFHINTVRTHPQLQADFIRSVKEHGIQTEITIRTDMTFEFEMNRLLRFKNEERVIPHLTNIRDFEKMLHGHEKIIVREQIPAKQRHGADRCDDCPVKAKEELYDVKGKRIIR